MAVSVINHLMEYGMPTHVGGLCLRVSLVNIAIAALVGSILVFLCGESKNSSVFLLCMIIAK